MAKKLTREEVVALLKAVQETGPADLSGANLSGVDLSRLHFGGAKLAGADLRNADLRGADFYHPDLTGARFEGANFEGCTLFHLEFAEDQFAHGGRVGPNLRRLQEVAEQCKRLRTGAQVLHPGGPLSLEIDVRILAGNRHTGVNWTAPDGSGVSGQSASLVGGFIKLANGWGRGQLDLETVTVKATDCPCKGKELKGLVRAAWCEAFALEPPTTDAPGGPQR